MSINEVLEAVKSGKISPEEAAKLLPSTSAPRALSCKVSEKGAVSVYGLNARFPITLYGDQWLRLLDFADSLRAFITANKSKLSAKATKE